MGAAVAPDRLSRHFRNSSWPLPAGPEGNVTVKNYWQINFAPAASERPQKSLEDYVEEFSELLVDAAKIRLRADVPVGAYLSGGLDSSIIASIIRNFTSNRLDTFSIAFNDVNFDESAFQRRMAGFLGTEHQVVQATHADIGRVFPDVVWHTEVPLMRTAPAPMFLLSKLVRDSGYQGGFDRGGCGRISGGLRYFQGSQNPAFLGQGTGFKIPPPAAQTALSGHRRPFQKCHVLPGRLLPRGFDAGGAAGLFARDPVAEQPAHLPLFQSRGAAGGGSALRSNCWSNSFHPQFREWDALAQAQYLEIKIFLSQYLLSSQGDRMAMAHAVEGRFPFLDYRLVAFCNQLPANLKLRGLTEKYLLKQLGRKWLPPEIWQRPKRPYRAPIHRSFFNEAAPDYRARVVIAGKAEADRFVQSGGGRPVGRQGPARAALGETDDMALVGILSTQLVHHHFIENFKMPAPLSESDPVKVRVGRAMALV